MMVYISLMITNHLHRCRRLPVHFVVVLSPSHHGFPVWAEPPTLSSVPPPLTASIPILQQRAGNETKAGMYTERERESESE